MSKTNQPDSSTIEGMILNASNTLDEALRPSWSGISAAVVKKCKGVLLFSVVERGLVITGQDGTGIVMEHNEDGTWGPPGAMIVTGVGLGATVGYEKRNAIVFIMDRLTMKAFESEQSCSQGISLDLAAGPVGRAGEVQLDSGDQSVGATYAYSFNKGAFVGAGLKLTGFSVQCVENDRFYGTSTTQKEILQGGVTIPEGNSSVAELHAKLQMLAGGETKEPAEQDASAQAAGEATNKSVQSSNVVQE